MALPRILCFCSLFHDIRYGAWFVRRCPVIEIATKNIPSLISCNLQYIVVFGFILWHQRSPSVTSGLGGQCPLRCCQSCRYRRRARERHLIHTLSNYRVGKGPVCLCWSHRNCFSRLAPSHCLLVCYDQMRMRTAGEAVLTNQRRASYNESTAEVAPAR